MKAPTEAEWLDPGTALDHFRVIRPLGRGGMAQVYLARDTRLGRKVALKVVLPAVLRGGGSAGGREGDHGEPGRGGRRARAGAGARVVDRQLGQS